MNNWTPAQNLDKACRELWSAINLLVVVERQIITESASWADLVEVEKVLRHAVKEVAYIVARNRGKLEKPLNIRQAQEFALKAKVAKAGEVAPAHRQLCPSDQSHK